MQFEFAIDIVQLLTWNIDVYMWQHRDNSREFVLDATMTAQFQGFSCTSSYGYGYGYSLANSYGKNKNFRKLYGERQCSNNTAHLLLQQL